MNGDASAKRVAFTNPNWNNFDNRPSSLGHNQRLACISYLVDESQAFGLELCCRNRTLPHSHDDMTLPQIAEESAIRPASPQPRGAKARGAIGRRDHVPNAPNCSRANCTRRLFRLSLSLKSGRPSIGVVWGTVYRP